MCKRQCILKWWENSYIAKHHCSFLMHISGKTNSETGRLKHTSGVQWNNWHAPSSKCLLSMCIHAWLLLPIMVQRQALGVQSACSSQTQFYNPLIEPYCKQVYYIFNNFVCWHQLLRIWHLLYDKWMSCMCEACFLWSSTGGFWCGMWCTKMIFMIFRVDSAN